MEPSDHTFSVIDESHPINTQKFDHKTVTKHLRAEVGRALILRECIMSVMLHPNIDTDVQTCLLKISEVLFKPSDESVPIRLPEVPQPVAEVPMPVSTKIRIHAPSAPPIEPAQSPAPLPKIILKDHQHHLANDTDLRSSSPPPAPAPEVPSKLALASHPLSQPFRKPVDPIRESAPDYFNIIHNPMDFKTMGIKLEMGQYPNREAFKDDVNLIFNNCKTYNLPDSSLVVKYVEPLKATFDKLWERSEKTMSAIQAKGLGGVNTARLPAADTTLIAAPNHVVPLAPPPSFAAFAAGGSMIPPALASPVSSGIPPPSVASTLSPEASRPGRLKVKLKPQSSTSTGGTIPEILPGSNSSVVPPPKSGLKIKFTPVATTSTLANNPPSMMTNTKADGDASSTSTYPTSLTFPSSSSSTFPPPPPPMISMAPPKSRLPPNPSFVPPPPPPTFESFSLAAQLGAKPTPTSTLPEKPPVAADIPSSTSLEKPTKSKKRQSSSQTASLDTPPPSSQPVKKNSLIVQFPRPPPTVPPPPPPGIITTSKGAGPTIGFPNYPAPPPPSLPQLDSKLANPTASESSIPLISSALNPPLPSKPTKIKVIQRPPPRQDHTELSVPPPTLPNSFKIKSKADKNTKLNITATSISLPPSKKSKTKKSTVPEHIDQASGHQSSPPLLAQTPDLNTSRSPSHVSRSPSTSTAAGRSAALAHPPPPPPPPPSSSLASEPVAGASPECGSGIPVDPIAVGAPTYLDEIKHPMDLSTMSKKLDQGFYKRQSDLMADFELIVSNCVQFNGAESHLGLGS
ncbi:hypothetical protein PCASD_12510 [Puccinia coronata f. sp. avenae]|uniref:Bromo domain-containing protein n=1 Tax=Puccinia coronata f. sp. avenae TaxID=200324 RepID=A0A2N5U7N2_9BASI|nr:hypothetical protein PCASD_12510 [Puccinia coronata f. sp. avenae]